MESVAKGSDGRRLFTAEFKRAQIDRILKGEVTASELSCELGAASSLIQRWKHLATKGAEAAVGSNGDVMSAIDWLRFRLAALATAPVANRVQSCPFLAHKN